MTNDLQNEQSLYRALETSRAEIRLLVLPDSDAAETESISASFRIVSLHESPEFYALSYVWGSPTMTQPLYVDGSEVLISPNLEHIIRVLLSHEKGPAAVRGKAIWIDALCIDQGNLAEKEQQIPLMRQIYRQATRVLMWLGHAEAGGHADWAMKCMKDPDFYYAASTRNDTQRPPTPDEIKLKLIMEEDLEKRTYWTRVWIGQEMVLATNDPLVLCGCHCVPWSHYVNLLQWLPANRGEYPEVAEMWDEIKISTPKGQDASRSSWMHRIFREAYIDLGEQDMNLAAVMIFTSKLSASNPRDFIYGCLGMVRPKDASLIIPTYSKSVADVFKEAFRIVWLFDPEPFNTIQSLSFHRVTASPHGLPSWAADLSNHTLPEFSNDTAGLRLRGNPRTGRANWRSPTWPTFDGDVMLLEAIEFDDIETTESVDFNYGWSPTFEDENSHDEMVSTLKTAEAMLDRGLQKCITDSDRLACFREAKLLDPIWRTMSHWPDELVELPEHQPNNGNKDEKSSHDSVWRTLVYARRERVMVPELEPSDSMSSVERERMLLWDILMRRQDIPEAWKEATSEEARNDERKLKATILNRLLHAIRRRSNHRKVLLTKNGFIGIATPYVEKGDVIVFVAGMQCPFVLRPFRDGYQMRGFAYVSGLMVWEVLDQCLERSGIVPKILKIY